MDFIDDLQRTISLPTFPQRIVSLDPRLTETVFALGAGERIVGVTDYSPLPPGARAHVTKVGGTKNPQVRKIIQLAPDLVIVNDQENQRDDFLQLTHYGLPLYVTAPRTVADGITMIDKLGTLLGCELESTPLALRFQELYQQVVAETARHPRLRVFCPLWCSPWMSFNGETYSDDMLRCCGGENIFRTNPERHFELALEEVVDLSPQVVLLPSEPYPFRIKHFVDLQPLAATPAGQAGHFYCIDGTALGWYGPRIADGLEQLSRLFAYVRATMD